MATASLRRANQAPNRCRAGEGLLGSKGLTGRIVSTSLIQKDGFENRRPEGRFAKPSYLPLFPLVDVHVTSYLTRMATMSVSLSSVPRSLLVIVRVSPLIRVSAAIVCCA